MGSPTTGKTGCGVEEIQDVSEEELWSMLPEATGHERIAVLAELAARAAQRRDFARETTCLEEAAATAREIEDTISVAELHDRLGGSRFRAGDYPASVDFHGRAADEFSRSGVNLRAAEALWGQADAYRMTGDFDRWLSASEQSRRLAESEDAPVLAADACFLQARALYHLDREAEAIEACQAGRDYYRRAGLPDRVAEIDDFAITVHCYLEQFDEAMDLARRCLVFARESQTERDDPYARERLAEVMQRRGDSEAALEQLAIAQAGYRQQTALVGSARCERLRGEALVSLDRLGEAQEAFLDARILFDSTGFDIDSLWCEGRRAFVLQWMGEFREAARIHEGLVNAWRGRENAELDLRWSVVNVLTCLYDAGAYGDCVEKSEELRDVWPDDITLDDASYREFLGLTAAALLQVGRADAAVPLADQVIEHSKVREAGIGTAYCYEIRGRSRMAEDEVAATQDLSHAIALHLAKGRISRARELSADFLPVDTPAVVSESQHLREQRGEGH